MASVFIYERRHNQRRPTQDFLDGIDRPMQKKFLGQCDALTKGDPRYCNTDRFCPLHGEAKPLWEFKEHANHLYCFRKETTAGRVIIVLFNGWTKSTKKGKKTIMEEREIRRAIDLYKEFLSEYPEEKHELLGN